MGLIFVIMPDGTIMMVEGELDAAEMSVWLAFRCPNCDDFHVTQHGWAFLADARVTDRLSWN